MSVTQLRPTAAPGTRAEGPGAEFLSRITQHIVTHGLSDAALRRLAPIAGTSHRMLVYYFGSRDGLLGAVLHELRGAESRTVIGQATSRCDALERAWTYYTAPERQLEMRLFFYLAGQAAHDSQGHADFTASIVATWTHELRQVCERDGMSPESAQAEARLLIAALRGLLLDRMLSGDEAGADVAFRRLASASSERV